jgi:putative RNA 2'-phosphotransferase
VKLAKESCLMELSLSIELLWDTVLNEKEKTSASRFINLILRHDSQKIGITLEHDGWADTDALIEGMNRARYRITLEDLKEIVTTNNK